MQTCYQTRLISRKLLGQDQVRIEPASTLASKRGGGLDLKAIPFLIKYSHADGDTGLTATVKTEPNPLGPFRLVAGEGPGRRRAN
jgi:hypothetical protein